MYVRGRLMLRFCVCVCVKAWMMIFWPMSREDCALFFLYLGVLYYGVSLGPDMSKIGLAQAWWAWPNPHMLLDSGLL